MNHCVCFMEWDHPHSMLATQTSLEPGSYSQRSRQTWFSTSLESYVSELHWNQSERQILVTLESTECWMPDSVYIYMGMDQYLLIPFLGGWTSINPSYFVVNYRGIGFWPIPISQRCSNERVLGSRRSHFLWRGELPLLRGITVFSCEARAFTGHRFFLPKVPFGNWPCFIPRSFC